MTGINIVTDGSGKLLTLAIKGYHSGKGGLVYSVTFICGAATLAGVANTVGLAVGTNNELVTWLAPGDSITLLTQDIGAICWQDSGVSSVLGISIELPTVYTLPGDSQAAPSTAPVVSA